MKDVPETGSIPVSPITRTAIAPSRNVVANRTIANNTAGNAGNLLISFGGNILGKLGKKGEVVESLEITTDLF